MTRSSVRTPLRLEVLTVTFVLPNVVVVPMNVMPIIIMPIVFIVFIVVVLSFLYRKAEAIYIIRYISRDPPSGVKHCLYFSNAKLRLFSFLRKLFLLCLKGSFPTGSGGKSCAVPVPSSEQSDTKPTTLFQLSCKKIRWYEKKYVNLYSETPSPHGALHTESSIL